MGSRVDNAPAKQIRHAAVTPRAVLDAGKLHAVPSFQSQWLHVGISFCVATGRGSIKIIDQ
jgi:hypothetical protein